MTRLCKSTRERMAKALVRHRFDERANALMAESVELFNAVPDERYDDKTRKLMKQLEKLHPGAFAKRDDLYLKVRGMHVQIGATSIGAWNAVRWTPSESVERSFLHDDDYNDLSPELASRIAEHALATKTFAEEVQGAYRKALGTLSQFTTAKKLAEEWPEAMPVIGDLIPTEDRTLPVVQLASINDEFGLPPADRKAA